MAKRKSPKPKRGEMEELSETEQRYFDSKGAEAPDAEPGRADSPDGAEKTSDTDAPEAERKVTGLLELESDEKPEGEGTGADAPETETEPETGQKESRRVPLGELLSERERRRNAEGQLARDRARLAALESHLTAIAEADGGLPDKTDDPEGYAKALAAWAERHKTLLTRMRAQAAQRLERTQAHARLLAAYQAQVEDFKKRQPDFGGAYAFLARDRDQELFALGYTDPSLRESVLRGEEQMIVTRALREGVNPAERIYAAARRRGYAPGGRAADRLKLAEKGQASAKSLGAAPGGATRAYSPEALAALDDTEFEEATKGAKWRRLWE